MKNRAENMVKYLDTVLDAKGLCAADDIPIGKIEY
jgi:hypothetical protein